MGKSKKGKTASSAELFRFVANDPIVTANLTAEEISKVDTWQSSDDYTFEFHEGHTTGDGRPIYIRPSHLMKSSEMSIPKINAVEANKGTYTTIANVINGTKLTPLNSTARSDLMGVIQDSYDYLVILARRYWKNEDLPQATQARASMSCTSCGATISGDVYLGQANAFGKYSCPICKKPSLK